MTMAVPFPEAQLESLIYMTLGSLITLVAVLSYYIRRLHERIETGAESEEQERSE